MSKDAYCDALGKRRRKRGGSLAHVWLRGWEESCGGGACLVTENSFGGWAVRLSPLPPRGLVILGLPASFAKD